VFPTADGHVTIGAGQHHFFEAFCKLAGVSELLADARFATIPDRVANTDALIAILSDATRRQPTALWVEQLTAVGVPCGPVYNHHQVLTHEQTVSRRMVEQVDHPRAGAVRTLGVAVKLSETPGEVRRAAPMLGEHADEIRNEIAARKA
jgi:CoA:oxalate CoA-transferase